MRTRFIGAAAAVLVSLAVAQSVTPALSSVEEDLRALLRSGPRVAGSPEATEARAFLTRELRTAGYDVREETFTYARSEDLGSSVQVAERRVDGNALQGSVSGEITAPVARVEGVGTSEDFRRVNVRGRVAVVARGQIPFLEKARNASAAGAVGLVIVNNQSGPLMGRLGDGVTIPVLGVSQEQGAALRDGASVTLRVRVRSADVRGVNVVAFKSGARPSVLFGAHVDSVPGSPGANDNASGTSAVLEAARRAANTPVGANAYFVLFDGEEDGLRGSRAFVQAREAELRDLKAMLNFDMVGVNVTPLSVGGTDALVRVARQAAPELEFMRDPGSSDHTPFEAAGVPALFFHRGVDVNYHRPGDTTADPALIRAAAEAGLKVAAAVLQAESR